MACYRDRLTFLYVDGVRTSQATPMGLHSRLRGQLYFLYVEDVRTPQEMPMGLHGLLRGQPYFLYVEDVRTSTETQASMACYGNSFTFLYVDDVTSQETPMGLPWLLSYGDRYRFLYVDDVRTSQETSICLLGLLQGIALNFICR
jgi:hypothetical protein